MHDYLENPRLKTIFTDFVTSLAYLTNVCFVFSGLADIAAKLTNEWDLKEAPPLVHTGFLKHVERTSCLLVILDALGFQANQRAPMRDPVSAAVLLISQLQRYSFGRLLGKPMLCAINKVCFIVIQHHSLLININRSDTY